MFGTVKGEGEGKKCSTQNSMKQDCTRELFPKYMGRIERSDNHRFQPA